MKRILLLEDEPPVMRFFRKMLKGYGVLEATAAEEALQCYINNNRRIRLLIAEVTLPIASGVQVALLLRQRNSNLPVILISGFPVTEWSQQDAGYLARLGSDSVAVLQKPFARRVLLNWVSEFIGAPLVEQARTAYSST